MRRSPLGHTTAVVTDPSRSVELLSGVAVRGERSAEVEAALLRWISGWCEGGQLRGEAEVLEDSADHAGRSDGGDDAHPTVTGGLGAAKRINVVNAAEERGPPNRRGASGSLLGRGGVAWLGGEVGEVNRSDDILRWRGGRGHDERAPFCGRGE